MPSGQNHHGFGQIEKQLQQQANAANTMQGNSEADREITEAANRDPHTSLDEVIDIEPEDV